MRGHLPASRATKRQRRRPENEPRYCRACLRAAPCSAKQASASSAPCLQSSAPDAASTSRLANMSLARAFHDSPPSQNGTTAACHTRLHRTRHALEIWIGQRLSRHAYPRAPASLRGPDRAPSQPACFGLLEGFRKWLGFLERRVATRSRTRGKLGQQAMRSLPFVGKAMNSASVQPEASSHRLPYALQANLPPIS